jgi:hypothetical protein
MSFLFRNGMKLKTNMVFPSFCLFPGCCVVRVLDIDLPLNYLSFLLHRNFISQGLELWLSQELLKTLRLLELHLHYHHQVLELLDNGHNLNLKIMLL